MSASQIANMHMPGCVLKRATVRWLFATALAALMVTASAEVEESCIGNVLECDSLVGGRGAVVLMQSSRVGAAPVLRPGPTAATSAADLPPSAQHVHAHTSSAEDQHNSKDQSIGGKIRPSGASNWDGTGGKGPSSAKGGGVHGGQENGTQAGGETNTPEPSEGLDCRECPVGEKKKDGWGVDHCDCEKDTEPDDAPQEEQMAAQRSGAGKSSLP
mmetsp:Transcript_96296/g.167213  ORF Transcript_96296/g.167213 Transcript_96296/m.167213 type:complete len:215 (+) Transcript_96296:27-671(+)